MHSLASFEMMQIVMIYLFGEICIISNLMHKVNPINILYDTILNSLGSNLQKKKKKSTITTLIKVNQHEH